MMMLSSRERSSGGGEKKGVGCQGARATGQEGTEDQEGIINNIIGSNVRANPTFQSLWFLGDTARRAPWSLRGPFGFTAIKSQNKFLASKEKRKEGKRTCQVGRCIVSPKRWDPGGKTSQQVKSVRPHMKPPPPPKKRKRNTHRPSKKREGKKKKKKSKDSKSQVVLEKKTQTSFPPDNGATNACLLGMPFPPSCAATQMLLHLLQNKTINAVRSH